jgi:hypothetical protein
LAPPQLRVLSPPPRRDSSSSLVFCFASSSFQLLGLPTHRCIVSRRNMMMLSFVDVMYCICSHFALLTATRERVGESVAFWGFFTFNMAIYSYIGQLFMCLVRGPGTAQILASIFIGINNFFSGLIVRPQQMSKSSQLISHFIVSSFVLTLPLSL